MRRAVLLAIVLAACDDDRLREYIPPAAVDPPAPPDTCTDLVRKDCSGVLGACGLSTEPVCSDGLWWCHEAGATPGVEVCNGQDDDCDGQVDEGLFTTCYEGPAGSLGVGVCRHGFRPCGLSICIYQGLPSPEVCNGADDDCDGVTDEGVAVIPGCCPDGSTEEVCDGKDNDCNGLIDEGLRFACGGMAFCLGEGPEEVPCDGFDNDCDGLTDEEGPARPLEVALALDVSGSNVWAMGEQKAALQAIVGDVGALDSCARFAVGIFGDNYRPELQVLTANVESSAAQAALAAIIPQPGAIEPSYDVVLALALSWDPNALRLIVMIADEAGQSFSGRTELEVAAALKGLGVEVLTFTDYPSSYDALGPALRLGAADIHADGMAFIRSRAGL